MSHFMMDCYFPDVTRVGGVTCDSVPIKALNEHEAIEEAKRAAVRKKPIRFSVRLVSNAGDRTIFET